MVAVLINACEAVAPMKASSVGHLRQRRGADICVRGVGGWTRDAETDIRALFTTKDRGRE
jgi:hypothetical protein